MRDYLLLDCENATIEDGKLRKYRGDAVHIRIPDDVHTILTPAFTAKMKIQSLFFGKSMKGFSGEYSFLEAIEVDAENPHYTAIDGVLFDKKGEVLLYYPKGKKDRFYQVPEHVKEIKKRAFYNNPYLNEVKIPDMVSQIGESAFSHCSNLEKVALPNKLTKIERMLFWESNLKEIDIPTNVTQIGDSAFENNRQLQHVVLPPNLQEIQKYAFSECENLTTIALPESLTKIAGGAFRKTGLRSIVFPEGIGEVASFSFSECLNLTEAKLPHTLHGIASSAFFNCENLTLIVFDEFKYENVFFWGCNDTLPVKFVEGSEETDENDDDTASQERHEVLDETMKQLNAVLEMYETLYNQVPVQQRKNAEMITSHRRRHIQDVMELDEEIARLSVDVATGQAKMRECGYAFWGEKARKRKHFAGLVEESQKKLRQCALKRTAAILNLHKIPTRPIAQYTSAGHNIKLYPTNQLDATFAIEYDGELLVYNACELSLADSNVNAQIDASELDKAIMTGIAAGSFAGYVATSAAQTYGNISEISLTLFDAENSSYKKIVFAANTKLTSQEYSRFASDYDQFAEKFGKMMVNISQDEVGAHNLIKSGLVDIETK